MDRNGNAGAGMRRTGGDWLGGRPPEPAEFYDWRTGFRGNTHGVGFEFPDFDQCTVAVPADGSRFGRRWRLFELTGLDRGQPGASLREPGGWGIIEPRTGAARIDQRKNPTRPVTSGCCNLKVVHPI